MSEVPFRILLLTGLQDKKTIYTIDIKKAFLESHVKEDIYIKPPEGIELIGDVGNNDVKTFKLNKAIYGLVQSSLNFYQEIKKFFIKNDYIVNPGEPCLLSKNIDKTKVLIGLYVDDILMSGYKNHILN